MESSPLEQNTRGRLTPFSIGVTYIVAGGAWFLITDEVINRRYRSTFCCACRCLYPHYRGPSVLLGQSTRRRSLPFQR